MAKVGFLTAVSFGNQPKSYTKSLLEAVDSYFYLGGKKAYVIPGRAQHGNEGTILQNDSSTCLVTAIKVISYATIILPAIMLITKIVLRSIHTFHLIQDPCQDGQSYSDADCHFKLHSNPINVANRLEAQNWLEKGIDISQETVMKIQKLMPEILRRKDNAEISWYASGGNLVFSLTSIPNLIFKMAPPNSRVVCADGLLSAQQLSELRFENMVKAVEVCAANQLNLLVIPHAKKFNVDEMILIAEERVDINQNESAQEHLYQLSGLNETARQLATFIAKTGFSDVEWRNMPLIDTAPEFQGNRRVALVDLEEMDGAVTGIFGSIRRRGLVRCLHSELQINIVLAEAERLGIRHNSPEKVKAGRMEEIHFDQQLQQFYMRNGILKDPCKPVQVDDLTTLGLNLDEQGELYIRKIHRNGSDEEQSIECRRQTTTLRDAVVDVIAQINEAIKGGSENASIKGKRYILLNTNHSESLKHYKRLGLSNGNASGTKAEKQTWFRQIINALGTKVEKQAWLRRIINALVAKGHLFKLVKVNGHGYFIQA